MKGMVILLVAVIAVLVIYRLVELPRKALRNLTDRPERKDTGEGARPEGPRD